MSPAVQKKKAGTFCEGLFSSRTQRNEGTTESDAYHRMCNVDKFAVGQRVGGSRWRSKVKVGHVKRALVRGSMRVRGPQKRHFEWDKFQMGVNAVRVIRVEI